MTTRVCAMHVYMYMDLYQDGVAGLGLIWCRQTCMVWLQRRELAVPVYVHHDTL